MRFLLENNRIINLSKNLINIDGAEYDLTFEDNTKTITEEQLIAKTRIYEITDIKSRIHELMKDSKKTNPVLGNIKNFEHKIELIRNFYLTRREYPEALGLQNEVIVTYK
ncbi:hypothetical protein DMUE_1254 [Dictyocoela muelleri]|nr:hypothetical protein DMUE_1254 [Dictyocoela muelleri]